ncbi:uncharacterized protein BT62DRAFT_947663 [Guyanagaster necrorhizus]|uniref:Uncharacterized protein n=1 Tax=Guyanagaster necrorhizus TaxID=856835 RepID=A0A9P7VW14_9AGAR|nr:uncharacterized protein BT62DRAFT_947663 [Guyanagaster necrorhizus MCA 3950]KAG7447582.1 hypothetical protein BT62DRAFT_947663 [Guyanagaster necrorhizus MCA 3950]
MAGAVNSSEGRNPSYLSAHSADVILSDIRPIKLKVEALHSINVFLDEFLYNIINTAQSLVTDRLRAGLLSLLPTPLGKEALLEAEVELRAYKDRTKTAKTVEDDKDTFNLAWAFELLRLKCQAYSTLNESDEDPAGEGLLEERMSHGHLHAPSPTLVAPAALYLTAILEAMCEHILSNVGRVASRDSSRTSAIVQDVFVALCEDETIYGLFKIMKVYSQIEEMSKLSRSKSISRSDKLSISRTSSPYDMSSKDSRISSEASSSMMAHTPTGSRTSLDKNKSMKKIISNSSRLSSDTNNTHKRSESILSEETKQTWAAFNQGLSFDDGASLQEFDDLMRSGSTMKVSLTPDRLKSMEAYKQERDRGNRRLPPLFSSELDPSSSPPRANGRRPSLRHVHSITEDEEPLSSSPVPSPRARQSIATPNSPPPLSGSRVRSFSVASLSSSSSSSRFRKYSKPSIPFAPSKPATPPPAPMAQSRRGGLKGSDASPFPPKTRTVQRNRESLDLDDVMAGSDDDDYDEAVKEPSKRLPLSVLTTPKRVAKVSSNTRELMDFLDAGPPSTGPPSTVPKVSRAAKDMMDFLNEGPPEYIMGSTSVSSTDIEKPKSGRLQRMMSKLSMGGEKSRGTQGNDDFGRSIRRQPSTPIIHSKPSHPNLPALANRPIPPRPPPISPPASPHDHYDDFSVTRPKMPLVASTVIPKVEVEAPSVPTKTDTQEVVLSQPPVIGHSVKKGEDAVVASKANHSPASGTEKSPSSSMHSSEKSSPIKPTENPSSRASNIIRKAPPPIVPDAPPQTVVNDMQDMHRLMSRATTVDECRVILELFLAKSGVAGDKAIEMEVPYPSPSSSDIPELTTSDIALEQALVEYFLGSEVTPEGPPLRKKKHSSRRIKAVPAVEVAPPPPSSGAVTSVMEDVTPKHTPAVIEVNS